jgi:hypothetical protein
VAFRSTRSGPERGVQGPRHRADTERQPAARGELRAGTVDVFDGSFMPVVRPGAFVDRRLPAGCAPFNVQALDGKIYVAYAKQDAEKKDEVAVRARDSSIRIRPTAVC